MRLRVRTVVAMSGAQRDSQRRGRLGLRLFHAARAFFAGSTRLAAVDTFLVRASLLINGYLHWQCTQLRVRQVR